MEKSLAQISEYLGGELVGDPATKISGVAPIEEARRGELTFLANPKYAPFLKTTSASAVIVGRDASAEGIKTPLIRHANPYFAFARAVELFAGAKKVYPESVHPTAVLAEGVELEKGVHLGPFVVLESGVWLRHNCTVLAGSFIGENSSVGEGCLIYPNVTIRENVEVGRNVIIHSGTVIGSDGFGYARETGVHRKVPQIGGVKIEDEVEIGANVTVDRAALGITRIGKGTKIDNLVQIGHNVDIGEGCIIVAQVGIGGSTRVGDNAVLAGQAGLVGHIRIGKQVVIGAQSGVTKDVPDGTTIFGYPAREIHKTKRIEAHLSRLDLYVQRLKEVERALKEIRQSAR
ncbi:MAG: UDP-3-O-(3-hydroxymyristoyl)glucosamine N-acyltransferase [Candidatus Zixiibacteriota bacterium]|nr:MAG: UDP-3-O-(3-hydroxymyristoyl)glucosamine N-acyltransferase [candidate division Zixibacteria bacterium]